MKINESQLRQIIRESIDEYKKKMRRSGKIQNKEGEWVDATEDGQDKNGNPMYRTKDSSITYGRKCKDGSRRVQDFNFRPNVNESKLRNIIKESIKNVLNESIDTDNFTIIPYYGTESKNFYEKYKRLKDIYLHGKLEDFARFDLCATKKNTQLPTKEGIYDIQVLIKKQYIPSKLYFWYSSEGPCGLVIADDDMESNEFAKKSYDNKDLIY